MRLVFDTSILIEIEKGNQNLQKKLAEISVEFNESPAITFPTFSEFYYGFIKKFPQKKSQALAELEKYHILNSTKGSAKLIAELKYNLEKQGTSLSTYDLFIAAIVIDNGMTLLTLDKQFQSVPNLNVLII